MTSISVGKICKMYAYDVFSKFNHQQPIAVLALFWCAYLLMEDMPIEASLSGHRLPLQILDIMNPLRRFIKIDINGGFH